MVSLLYPRLNFLVPSVYDGIAVTRGMAPSLLRSETQAMSRFAFFTRSAVSYVDFTIANWYGAEIPTGSTMSATINVEYSPGVVASAVSTTIPSGSQATMRVTFPAGANAQAWLRAYLTNANGIPWNGYQGQNLALGDALILGNSGIPDLTGGGTVTDGGTFGSVGFLAGVAPISIPSILILGNSIAAGVNADHTPNSTGDSGSIAPSIAPSFGYSNMGVNAEAASSLISNHTNRGALFAKCSHAFVEYDTNGIYLDGISVAASQANLTTIYGYLAGKTIFQSLLMPRSSTNDGQTPVTAAGEESRRVAFNAALRAATFGPNGGYIDPESVVGTGTNNSLWKAGYTNDGVHPTTTTYYTTLQGSGYIDLSRIHR